MCFIVCLFVPQLFLNDEPLWIEILRDDYPLGDSAKAVFLENEESRYILFTYMAIESH